MLYIYVCSLFRVCQSCTWRPHDFKRIQVEHVDENRQLVLLNRRLSSTERIPCKHELFYEQLCLAVDILPPTTCEYLGKEILQWRANHFVETRVEFATEFTLVVGP